MWNIVSGNWSGGRKMRTTGQSEIESKWPRCEAALRKVGQGNLVYTLAIYGNVLAALGESAISPAKLVTVYHIAMKKKL